MRERPVLVALLGQLQLPAPAGLLDDRLVRVGDLGAAGAGQAEQLVEGDASRSMSVTLRQYWPSHGASAGACRRARGRARPARPGSRRGRARTRRSPASGRAARASTRPWPPPPAPGRTGGGDVVGVDVELPEGGAEVERAVLAPSAGRAAASTPPAGVLDDGLEGLRDLGAAGARRARAPCRRRRTASRSATLRQYWPSQLVMRAPRGRRWWGSAGRARRRGDGAAAGDGALVGAEVGGDDPRVVADLVGRARGDDRAGLEAVDAVADRHDERHVVLDDEHRRRRAPRGCAAAAARTPRPRAGRCRRSARRGTAPGRRWRAGRPARRCGACRSTAR